MMSIATESRFPRPANTDSVGTEISKVRHLESSTDADHSQLKDLLDQVHSELSRENSNAGNINAAVDRLFRGLRSIRETATKDQWKGMIRFGRNHSLCQLVHQDPFTSRAFNKPRGYAGDAVMMDYIYGREEAWGQPEATALGSAIFQYTTGAPASAGVRERRCYVAEMLDRIGREKSDQQVLAVAAGHLREASLSSAIRRNRFERFVAMDADAESLEEIRDAYGRFGVEAVVANIRRMLTGRLDLGTFDLIYTTGLYDYLTDATAKRLTANLFDHVRPGGRLVIANFLPEIRDVGYMEMYMDWHLIYRSRGQMMMLADDLDQASVAEVRIFAENNENVVIMEMTKR
ncbi:hypothetical protein Q31b_57870 [Novipirellula aureliae]|uniref:Methyltransferase domain-containing protein n=1 Tax=Novipirellula aureliae TaxID=2527966 RepID=A0A5C6DE39_9BACT|nr:class I SAM-dependent methyltransferase [Novipirellula aureliae]TWU33179.1 hypothetical protein Q31b_57870 [Novipirellula aureliae]